MLHTHLPKQSSNRAFRGLSGTYNVRANERDRAAPRDIECLVHFLNNTHHKFIIDRRSKGQALLDSVFKHLNLIETDFFGLKYLPQEQHSNQHDDLASNNKQDSLSQQSNGRIQSSSNLLLNSSSSSSSTTTKGNGFNNNNNNINIHDNHYANHVIRERSSPVSKNSCLSSPSPPIVNQEHLLQNLNHNYEPYRSASQTAVVVAKPNTIIATTLPTSTIVPNTCPIICSPVVPTNLAASVPPPASSTQIKAIVASAKIRDIHCIQQTQTDNSVSIYNNYTNNGNIDEDQGFVEERWLDPAKSIRKQYKSGPPYKFYFRVRFYVSDPSKLADDTTRNHLYLQLRQDIINNRLVVPTCSAILLASYILQSEFGDYRRELLDEGYASKIKLMPDENDDLRKKVIELHKQHKSLSSADAEYQFLEHAAKQLDCYGVEFYDAKDQFKTNVLIGVSSSGIVVFKENKKMSQFSWAKIIKIMFKKKMFSVQLRREEKCKGIGSCDNFIEFNLLTNQACKSFWEECVAQHSFFRLHQPKSPPKKFFSFLNFGSKFQYNGKTEYQTMEESRKRSFSHFSRTLSKRYARRTLPIGRPLWGDQTELDPTATASASVEPFNNQKQHDTTSDSQSHISTASSSSSRASSNNIPRDPEALATLAESIRLIKRGLEKGDLITKFEKLSRKKEDESHEESRLMENIDKNRYQDILPYDSTRVQLMDSMTGDYINASFVDMAVPSGMLNRYIATQGPLSSTCDDFWQMIWEQNCSLIIMVTPLIEAGRVKCHKYWPDEKDEIRYGQLLIRNLNEKSKSATIDRTVQVIDVKVSTNLEC